MRTDGLIAEKHAGILWQTWACGKTKFKIFRFRKLSKIFFNIPIKKLLILGKNVPNSFFLGKKENLKIFLKKLNGKHGPQSENFFF